LSSLTHLTSQEMDGNAMRRSDSNSDALRRRSCPITLCPR
jgi:hypothetical protein